MIIKLAHAAAGVVAAYAALAVYAKDTNSNPQHERFKSDNALMNRCMASLDSDIKGEMTRSFQNTCGYKLQVLFCKASDWDAMKKVLADKDRSCSVMDAAPNNVFHTERLYSSPGDYNKNNVFTTFACHPGYPATITPNGYTCGR